MDVCVCLVGADGRVVEGRATLSRHHLLGERGKAKKKKIQSEQVLKVTPIHLQA
jgi:hypothetical protein